MSNTQPTATDRVAFVGKTGSGKTYAARMLMEPLNRLLVVDPKGSESIAAWGLEEWDGPVGKVGWRSIISRGIDAHETEYRQQKRIMSGKPFRYRFVPPKGYDYESLWGWVWDNLKGLNTTIYIDELYLTLREGRSAGGENLRALYTQGREKKIGVWACMQRPSWVPLFTLSESEWVFNFRLSVDEDRQRMSKIIGKSARDADLKGHRFLAYHQEWDDPQEYESIEMEL